MREVFPGRLNRRGVELNCRLDVGLASTPIKKRFACRLDDERKKHPMPDATLTGCLQHAGQSNRGVRFIDRREKETFFHYREIYRRARQVAGALERRGVRPGDRVAVILPTGIDFFDAFYGALLMGAVPVPLYPPVRLGRLDEYHAQTADMLRICRARMLLTNRRIGRVLGRTLRRVSAELVADNIEDLPRNLTSSFVGQPDQTALIQFSSGTSASPKPVRLTHRQILANVEALRAVILEAYPEDSMLTHVGASWLPLYHDMGLVGAVLTAVAHPSDLVLIPPEIFVNRPAIWLRTISRYRATVSPAPNFAYALCAARVPDEELVGVDLSSWRLALNGAEPVTPSVLDRFLERFQPLGLREEALTPVYGLSEATLAVTFSDPLERFHCSTFDRARLTTDGVAEPSSNGQALVGVGRPLPGYRLRIVDEEGMDLPSGRLGRILVRGPSIMEGYDEPAFVTSEVLKDGWLDTGDTGFIHEERLFLYDRKKDLIILRGRNYAPHAIEQALEGLSGLRAGCWAALGMIPEGGEGEELVVLVERNRSGRASKDKELARSVSSRISERTGLVADRVLVLEPGTLPRTSSGKIRRAEARKRLLTKSLTPPKSPNVYTLLGEMLLSKVGRFHRKFGSAKKGKDSLI